MEQFVVSARKYRPATFDSVVGQESVTSTLKNAIRSGHLAQAFLFTGPRGVGKTTCARILARTMNCEKLGEDLVPCGQCAPCKTFEEGHSLNIFELDAASNNGVEEIRNLILQVSIAPQVGTKKVYIIDEVHMLSQSAFNAFLKTLEEPPSYAIFILATTEKHKILPTILSRCQVFDFRRIMIADIVEHLADIAAKEGIEVEAQALHVIASKADGGLRDALSIFDQLVSFAGNRLTYQDAVQNLNVLDHEHYFRITDSMITGDVAAALVEYNAILQQGFDGHLFITGFARHLRDLLVCKDERTLPLLEVSDDLTSRYAEQADKASPAMLVKGLDLLAKCDSLYKQSKEPRLLVELTLIQLCTPVGMEVSEESRGATTKEKKSPDRGVERKPQTRSPVPGTSEAKAVVEAVTPTKADSYVPKRRLPGQVSIKAAVTEAEEKTTPDLSIDRDGSMPKGTKAVNHALLIRAWNDYATRQKGKGKDSLHATLMASEPRVTGQGLITFAIVNEVQENYLRTEKPELLGHLRRSLEEPSLELEVVKEEAKLKPRFTVMDRFKTMAERNPALMNFKQTLDLDLG